MNMSDKDTPLGSRSVPQYILDALVEDSRNLRQAAERIEEIMSTQEGIQNARVNDREIHDLCETCLAAVVNLFDLSYPSRPRVDLSLGYEFHSGPVGFITGGSSQQQRSDPYTLEIDKVRQLTVAIKTPLVSFLESYQSESSSRTQSTVIEEALELLHERELERFNRKAVQD
jgi:hypothetical protein